ncbi:MAG: hypothetical protein LUD73_05945 [Lachnospiraceae bacterium]|nr:hypothetical protein [Lachnospiraceae bacterium]MCD8248723.1 hypothetical protein [Lachnospiraceae bacterium]
MKLVKTLLCGVGAVFLCALFTAIPTEARSAFDPSYYAAMYTDAMYSCGGDNQALYEHYMTVGIAEGRYPNRQAEWRAAAGNPETAEELADVFLMTIPASNPYYADSDLDTFDPIHYYNTYADVAAVIGEDPVALLNHYFAYGYSEGRDAYYDSGPCVEVKPCY